MKTKPRFNVMKDNDGRRIDRDFYDVIECALRNDFQGVDRALLIDPAAINAQRVGTGITALMGASGRGLERMVLHLLSKDGIRLDISDDFGNDAFDHARPFPHVVAALMRHSHPRMPWKEPGVFPV